ncbi:hypothetical protein PHYBOEH_009523 [Phytophthora boehmeriae]|uniref:Protein kinase domain-containing protein n=1 Tax=Phytophthora boehmeriae TaxID=109152 RepID=A0A8T1X006_9STRA|nr:hypothetical protein PHYBOEH_009523 [Phytophthora boehmeriae]
MISFSSQRGTTGDYSRGETARTSQVAGLTNTGESRRTQPLPPRESYELGTDSGPGYVWKLLLEDPNLATKRLWYTDIKLRPRLARSQSREIRLGEFRGKKVIIKRLLRTKRSQSFYVQEFVYQIQLRAAITHPHIVAFIGVAWNNLTDLMMVLEFLPLGDLATYLQRFGNELSWENSKYRIAVGIARALVYLHNYATPVVHRDLRASNVLLTREMEAKVTGFDSSCASEDSHRSHLVGGSFWSAPEVLRGKEYTDKSDIYAFGVLLTELDMTKPPYHDAFSSIGARLKPDQILNEVVQGTMRPSFSQECPRRIRVIGVGCYQHDPQRRPTAKQLLRLLEA